MKALATSILVATLGLLGIIFIFASVYVRRRRGASVFTYRFQTKRGEVFGVLPLLTGCLIWWAGFGSSESGYSAFFVGLILILWGIYGLFHNDASDDNDGYMVDNEVKEAFEISHEKQVEAALQSGDPTDHAWAMDELRCMSPDVAEDICRTQGLLSNPIYAEILLNQASKYRFEKRFTNALKIYKQLVQQFPDSKESATAREKIQDLHEYDNGDK